MEFVHTRTISGAKVLLFFDICNFFAHFFVKNDVKCRKSAFFHEFIWSCQKKAVILQPFSCDARMYVRARA